MITELVRSTLAMIAFFAGGACARALLIFSRPVSKNEQRQTRRQVWSDLKFVALGALLLATAIFGGQFQQLDRPLTYVTALACAGIVLIGYGFARIVRHMERDAR